MASFMNNHKASCDVTSVVTLGDLSKVKFFYFCQVRMDGSVSSLGS